MTDNVQDVVVDPQVSEGSVQQSPAVDLSNMISKEQADRIAHDAYQRGKQKALEAAQSQQQPVSGSLTAAEVSKMLDDRDKRRELEHQTAMQRQLAERDAYKVVEQMKSATAEYPDLIQRLNENVPSEEFVQLVDLLAEHEDIGAIVNELADNPIAVTNIVNAKYRSHSAGKAALNAIAKAVKLNKQAGGISIREPLSQVKPSTTKTGVDKGNSPPSVSDLRNEPWMRA